MQTHEDRDFIDRLHRRAASMMRNGASEITAGRADEVALLEYKSHGVHVRQLPPDEQGILRISIGGGIEKLDCNYCVFRGDRAKCVFLLRAALNAMEAER